MSVVKYILLTGLLACYQIAAGDNPTIQCKPFDISIPCKKDAWNIGLQTLYLKPSYNQSFAYPNTTPINGTRVLEYPHPTSSTGFGLKGNYSLNQGHGLSLAWYHYEKSTNQTYHSDNNGQSVLHEIYRQDKPNWNAFNAELSQTVKLSPINTIHFHAGVQYLDLKLHINQRYNNQATIEQLRHHISGLGPRVGLQLSQSLGHGFSVYTNAASTLIVGKNDYETDSTTTPKFSSFTATIPEIEEKLGIQFQQPFTTGGLTLYAGYLWLNYFNSFFNPEHNEDTNFALTGPYAGVRWSMDS